ncbi:hypothetical protein NONO_c61040 [Nocardia nova SH22a]|uniref:Uncharacterized protein n=1 Tax=Nocardia nova SH22a TaxID=1415166 RepID=W5TNH4_9NOCA|nr:hypothetical protein [Nocardia nova]AHH20880.1 hypothetical protein NONO_c61040 [Nocardia nova SH22a]
MNRDKEFQLSTFGHVIEGPGVYQALPAAENGWAGKWCAFQFDNGFQSRSIAYATEAEARQDFWDCTCRQDRFWWEKYQWMRDGDSTGETRANGMRRAPRRDVLRIDGWHYVPRVIDAHSPAPVRGFGGVTYRWRWLDDPTQTVHWSDDVFTQGEIPAQMRHILPDNAVFVTE